MGLFSSKKAVPTGIVKDFEYLQPKALYFDSACQTLRPQPVLDAINKYYTEFNACGGRVKYDWGLKVDDIVADTRAKFLKLLGKRDSDYTVSFTLNTTYGLNLVLGQLPAGYKKIVTSEIEHNSVFLSTMSAAKRLNIPRVVLERKDNGELIYNPEDLEKAVVVLNSTSNIDGRRLENIKDVIKDTHARGGIVILDAAQSVAHDRELLKGADFDALCTSSHKMYGPSLGVIVIKKTLLKTLEFGFIGGGMVDDVQAESFVLSQGEADLSSRLEPGLQDFAGIIGLHTALDWLENYRPEGESQLAHEVKFSETLYKELSALQSVTVINNAPHAVLSFYSSKIDAHRLAAFLSEQGIMVRSGYFCCHYFLKNKKQYPPLVRVSLGLHNTEEQVKQLLVILKKILENI